MTAPYSQPPIYERIPPDAKAWVDAAKCTVGIKPGSNRYAVCLAMSSPWWFEKAWVGVTEDVYKLCVGSKEFPGELPKYWDVYGACWRWEIPT